MKSMFVCTLLLLLPLNLVNPDYSFAQELVAFQMTRIQTPEGVNVDRTKINDIGIVIKADGYIHDQYGLIGNGTLETTYSIYELANVPSGWSGMNLHNINDDDVEIVGRIIDPNGVYRAFYVNLAFVNPESGKSDFVLLPDLGSPLSAARGINNDGEIAVQYQLPDGSHSIYITHRDDLTETTPLGYAVANAWTFKMNNRLHDPVTGEVVRNAQLMVELPNGDISLYTLGDPVSQVYNLDELAGKDIQGMDLNDYGDVSGRTLETQVVPDKGKKTKTIIVNRAMLFESPFLSAPLEVGGTDTSAWGTNNAGDVVGFDETSGQPLTGFLVRDGVSYDLDDYVNGNPDDLQFWLGRVNIQVHDINERDVTGFGQIVVTVTQSTGNRRNRTIERRLYLLSPVVQ